jgi:hypothetical protein
MDAVPPYMGGTNHSPSPTLPISPKWRNSPGFTVNRARSLGTLSLTGVSRVMGSTQKARGDPFLAAVRAALSIVTPGSLSLNRNTPRLRTPSEEPHEWSAPGASATLCAGKCKTPLQVGELTTSCDWVCRRAEAGKELNTRRTIPHLTAQAKTMLSWLELVFSFGSLPRYQPLSTIIPPVEQLFY